MKTRCPRCSTRYQVDAPVIDRAGGKARCYKCGLVFDAASNAFDEPLEATVIDRLYEYHATPAEVSHHARDEVVPGSVEAIPDSPAEPLTDETFGVTGTVTDATGPTFATPDGDGPAAARAESLPIGDWPPVPETSGDPLPESLDIAAAPRPKADMPPGPERNTDQVPGPAAADNGHDPLASLRRPQRVPRRYRWAFWSLAALALVQITWLQRDALLAVPELRSLAERACAMLGCRVAPVIPGGANFVVVSREIVPATNYANHLEVRIDFAYRGGTSTPLPNIWLGLYNTEERLIASRRLQPADYVGTRDSSRMAGNEIVSASLLIEDPGEAVTGFKLEFFPTPDH